MATNIISRENAEAIIREQIVDAIAQDTQSHQHLWLWQRNYLT